MGLAQLVGISTSLDIAVCFNWNEKLQLSKTTKLSTGISAAI